MPTLHHQGEEENQSALDAGSDTSPTAAVKRVRPCRLHLEFTAALQLPPAQHQQLQAGSGDRCSPGGSPLSPISANPSVLQAGRKRRKLLLGSASGLHEFHTAGILGKQPQLQQQQLYGDCEGETAHLPNVGPTRVLDHLYIGSQADSLDAEVMLRLGITHVLNVSVACPQSQHVPDANFLRIPVNDGYTDKLLPHFQRAFSFLENVRESSGRCLVHCLAGISRSPTLTIAYVMKHSRMSQDEAYRFVKQQRQHISPNFNFLGQLLEFERQLRRSGGGGGGIGEAPPAASDDRRPEAKRQRTVAGGPALSAATPQTSGSGVSGILMRRPRSVLLATGQVGDSADSRPVRRSRSSDAFLSEVDPALEDETRSPVGPVLCLS